eukprot:TRINITY_DN7175_c0_g1_i7.p1 TRINITY_DN7175_c0_g1~~TRINITY_DN7175_c0_g1_i7.p1  ORF type:complete len:245 (-),score=50.96 TRINITY_DN7175_c0_g1_i7:397-1131(-)
MQEAEKTARKESFYDLEPYYKVHAENMPRKSQLHSSELAPVLCDDPTPSGAFEYLCLILRKAVGSSLDAAELALDGVLPQLLRAVPSCDESYVADDVQWIRPEVQGELIWNYSQEASEEELIDKARRLEMSRAEELMLIDIFKDNPEAIIELGFTSDMLPSMVEKYTELCIQIFHSLNEHKSIERYCTLTTSYYYYLTNTPFTRQFVAMLLILNSQVEIPLAYLEVIIGREIEAQVKSDCVSYC